MNDNIPNTKQQFRDNLIKQRESIINHERISQEIGIELTDHQAGHVAGMLRMCTMIIEQIDECINKV